jgi:hypothetical protein
LQLSEVTSETGPPDGAVFANRAETKPLVKRYTVSDRQATSSVPRGLIASLFLTWFTLIQVYYVPWAPDFRFNFKSQQR